jgi:hypothetical protein
MVGKSSLLAKENTSGPISLGTMIPKASPLRISPNL